MLNSTYKGGERHDSGEVVFIGRGLLSAFRLLGNSIHFDTFLSRKSWVEIVDPLLHRLFLRLLRFSGVGSVLHPSFVLLRTLPNVCLDHPLPRLVVAAQSCKGILG